MATTEDKHEIEKIFTYDALLCALENYTRMPIREVDSKLKALRAICAAFSTGGLSEIILTVTYDDNVTIDEDWTCNVKLPDAVETKNQILAHLREKFYNQQAGHVDNEKNETVFSMSHNLQHDVGRIVSLVNANIRAQNKTTAKSKTHQKLTHRDFTGLLAAIRALTSPMANGRVWEDTSRFYRRRYTPQKVTIIRPAANPLDAPNNYDSNFDENQRLIEFVNGVITKITVRTQPFNISISEELTVSRIRQRRFILENMD